MERRLIKNNHSLDIAKKNTLWSLIKSVGEFYNENKKFLEEYAKDVYDKYRNDIDTAIKCFEDLKEQTKWIKKDSIKFMPKFTRQEIIMGEEK